MSKIKNIHQRDRCEDLIYVIGSDPVLDDVYKEYIYGSEIQDFDLLDRSPYQYLGLVLGCRRTDVPLLIREYIKVVYTFNIQYLMVHHLSTVLWKRDLCRLHCRDDSVLKDIDKFEQQLMEER